ncbi:MAG: hypothetical protein AAFP82_02825 [Bacteroidota bacterium]
MKKTYIVIHQLGENSDKSSLIEYLKSFPGWARITDNSWAVVSEIKAKEIRDELLKYKGEDGRIFVIKSGVEAAWSNTRGKNQWFKNNL